MIQQILCRLQMLYRLCQAIPPCHALISQYIHQYQLLEIQNLCIVSQSGDIRHEISKLSSQNHVENIFHTCLHHVYPKREELSYTVYLDYLKIKPNRVFLVFGHTENRNVSPPGRTSGTRAIGAQPTPVALEEQRPELLFALQFGVLG